MSTAEKKASSKHQQADGKNLYDHQSALYGPSRPNSETIHSGQDQQGQNGNLPVSGLQPGYFQKIPGERNRHRGHAAGLDYEQQDPSVQKSNEWMVHITQECVLPPDLRHAVRELCPYEGPNESDDAAQQPRSQHQSRSVHPLSNNIGVDKNP